MQPQSHGLDHSVPIGFMVHVVSRRAALHHSGEGSYELSLASSFDGKIFVFGHS